MTTYFLFQETTSLFDMWWFSVEANFLTSLNWTYIIVNCSFHSTVRKPSNRCSVIRHKFECGLTYTGQKKGLGFVKYIYRLGQICIFLILPCSPLSKQKT